MRTFSLRLLLVLVITTCTVALGSAWSVYAVARANQLTRMRQKLRTLAVTAATFVDSQRFASLTRPEQHGNADWEQIAAELRKIQGADPEIKFIYALAKRPDTDETGILQFIVDATLEEDENGNGVIDPEERNARLGEAYNAGEDAPDMLEAFDGPTCDKEMTTDQWGTCLSGYAPIRDSEGNTLGIVGVDVMATHLAKMRSAFLRQVAIVVLAVIVTSVLVCFLLSRHINRPVKVLHAGMEKVNEGDLDVRVEVATHDEFERLAESFNTMIAGLREKQLMRNVLDHYMSKEVADIVVQRGESFFKTVERRRVSILFCDLQGMTAISEQRTPEETTRILGCFFEQMIEAVFRYGGIVDKLLGDGLMALFGTPLDMSEHEDAAIRCAIDMRNSMDTVRAQTGIPDLEVGVGISTGSVVVGNVGSGKLLDYTVIGDAVNVAARLQHMTREHNMGILVSQATAEPVKGKFDLQMLGPAEVRGRAEPIVLYAVRDHHMTDPYRDVGAVPEHELAPV